MRTAVGNLVWSFDWEARPECAQCKLGSSVFRLSSSVFLVVTLLASTTRAADERGNVGPIGGGDPITLRPAGTRRPAALSSPDGESLWRTAGALLAVVAGVGIVLALVRRFVPGLSTRTTDRMIQVIGQCPLAGRGTVYVIRCGPRVLIVGATAHQITTLAEIADPEDIQQFLSGTQTRSASEDADENSPRSRVGLLSPQAASVTGLKDQVHGAIERIQSWKSST